MLAQFSSGVPRGKAEAGRTPEHKSSVPGCRPRGLWPTRRLQVRSIGVCPRLQLRDFVVRERDETACGRPLRGVVGVDGILDGLRTSTPAFVNTLSPGPTNRPGCRGDAGSLDRAVSRAGLKVDGRSRSCPVRIH